MGQDISQYEDDQNDGSTIFGYTSLAPVSDELEIEEQNTLQDNVFLKPFLYGFVSTDTSAYTDQLENENRIDSGLFLLNGRNQLSKDLKYVDQTYYNGQKTHSKVAQEEDTIVRQSNPSTFEELFTTRLEDIYEANLTNRGFRSIELSIGRLSMMRKLDLSHNHLKEIPEAIGHLNQLEILCISHNRILSIPSNICHLARLIELDISNNQIRNLTPFVYHLMCLQTLNLSCNFLQELTCSVEGLQNLVSFDLSFNPISALPAEITHLPHLRRLRLDGCPLKSSLSCPILLLHNPPSLLEICARNIVRHEPDFLLSISKTKRARKTPEDHSVATSKLKLLIPNHLYRYLCSSKPCSHCRGPYFDTYVTRGRWVERGNTWIPLEYRLCSAHWSDELDRIHAMFSTSSTVYSTISTFKLFQPELVEPDLVSLNIQVYKKSCFFHEPILQSSSSTTPSQTQVEQELHEQQLDLVLESSSAVKRWKSKICNHSSFLKSHHLCL